MFNLSLLFLPEVAIAHLDRLPSKSGIYYAIDDWGNVRYVGMSSNLHRRWNGEGRYRHHKRCALEMIGGVTLKYRLVTEHRLEFEEAIDIANFKPDLNRQFPNPADHHSFRIFFDDVLQGMAWMGYSAIAALIVGQSMGIPTLSNLAAAARHHIEAPR